MDNAIDHPLYASKECGPMMIDHPLYFHGGSGRQIRSTRSDSSSYQRLPPHPVALGRRRRCSVLARRSECSCFGAEQILDAVDIVSE